ncbi:MAG: AAA family ATPase, partial [Thermodesulfobacteria bacterium]|nr:AAA family ATPase [Thermodesulfobacteriota bacterium]
MRLKSLVLSGFKSFPRRTVIKFSHGVSAIVGPNGSGKSNIVDAIRWVLGEQNPRMLRAERMEDLIFSGNSKFAPDAARVKLKLDQCQDMAPPELKDLSEIEIERILFRDGASKFLLNGKVCRLKEIRYLFLDTGTGARAYSIIDQGRVGQFVTMTPEERRAMVEEAAGIARYRERRMQALSRMKTTLENLDRLEDVIAEVKRQRNALKRQAAKAEKYMELRKEEDRLGLLILKARATSLQSEEGILRNSLREKEQKKAGVEAELSALVMELSGLDLELEKLFSKQKELRQREEAIKDEEEAAFQLKSRLERELALLRQQEEAVREEIARLEGSISGLNRAISRCKAEIEDAKEALEKVRQQISSSEEEFKRREEALTKLKERREEIKDEFVVTASKRAAIFEKLSSLREKKENLEFRLERMSQKREELEEERARLTKELKGFEEQLANCENELKQLVEMQEAKRQTLLSLQEEIKALQGEKASLSAQYSQEEARFKALSRLEQEGTGLSDGTRRLRKELGQRARLVADVIEVEDGFEDLVEVALGVTLQALVVEERQVVLDVLENVRKGQKDLRGIGFLLGWNIAPEPAGSQREENKGEVILGSKVHGEETVARCVRGILNRWKVVDCLERLMESVEGAGQGEKGDYFFLSRDGFLYTPWGELRHVSIDSGESGIIYRKKELRRLEGNLEKLRALLDDVGQREAQLHSERKGLEAEVSRLSGKINGLEGRKKSLEKSLLKARSRLEGVEDRIELMLFEQEEMQDEYHSILPEIERLEQSLVDAEKEEQNLKRLLQDVDAEYGRKELELKEFQRERNRLMLKEQEIKGQLRNAEKELGRLEGSICRAKETIGQKKRQLKELSEKQASVSDELERARQRAKELREAREGLSGELRAIEEEIEGLREKRLVIERKKSETQKLLSGIEAEIGKLRIRLSEIAKNMEHLEEVCQEQFRR